MDDTYQIKPIGFVRSTLKCVETAPRQGNEGAPEAWLEIKEEFIGGLHALPTGTDLFILTWLHQARRDVLHVHPRDDLNTPLTGVFATRSPHRPNPVGLHRVSVLEYAEYRLKVAPLEAIDGTPVIDIKPVLRDNANIR